MRRSLLAALLVGFAVAAGVAVPASASPAHQCQDGERLVHGGVNPLIVAGTHCTVDSVNVGGKGATISGDGHLTALDSTFHGPVALQDRAVLQLTRSTVDGSITSNQSSLQVTLLHSHIHGQLFGQGRQDGASSQTVRDTIIDEDLNWGSRSTDHLFVTHDQVRGVLVSSHTDATILDTTAGIGLDSIGDQGLQMCNVTVTGDLTINGYIGPQPAYVGAYADPNTTCAQPVVSGNLDITDSKATVYLGNVIVNGQLYCDGNSVRPVVSPSVVVRGQRRGQCR